MATLIEIRNLAIAHGDLQAKVEGAMIKAAWDVMNESAETSNHTNRIVLAKKILLDVSTLTKKYYCYFLSNATVQTNGQDTTDNDIIYVVNSFYDIIANAEA